jgi:hypothetical protein
MATITYTFTMEQKEITHSVDIDRPDSSTTNPAPLPPWVKLENNQCTNCPLKKETSPCCPVAVDLTKIINDFQKVPAINKVVVKVKTQEREYLKQTTVEEGVRALIGVVMASSGCPILSTLKPMVRNHLPFVSQDEYMSRMLSHYLLKEFFKRRKGQEPDWELKGMLDSHKQLQLVNHGFWQRIYPVCEKDSNIKALLSFFTLSSNVTKTLDAQLDKLMESYV